MCNCIHAKLYTYIYKKIILRNNIKERKYIYKKIHNKKKFVKQRLKELKCKKKFSRRVIIFILYLETSNI